MKLLDYIFFTRPLLFFPAWSSMLLYRILSQNTKSGQYLAQNLYLVEAMLAFAFLMASSFILNQLADIETDRVNKKLFFLHEGIIAKKEAIFLSVLLAILGLSLAFYLSRFQFYLGFVFLLVTGIFYNFKPFLFKQKIIAGLFANIIMGVLACLFTIQSIQEIHLEVFVLLTVLNTIFYVWTTVPDKKGDLQSQKRTIGNRLSNRSLSLLNFSLLAFYIVFAYQGNFLSNVLIGFTFFSLVAISFKLNRIELWIKLNLFLQGLAVSFYFLDYLLLMFAAFLVTKYYYKMRFNFDYPNFK